MKLSIDGLLQIEVELRSEVEGTDNVVLSLPALNKENANLEEMVEMDWLRKVYEKNQEYTTAYLRSGDSLWLLTNVKVVEINFGYLGEMDVTVSLKANTRQLVSYSGLPMFKPLETED